MLPDKEETTIGSSELAMKDFNEVFLGNVDLVKDDSIAGWVVAKDDIEQGVKVGLWIGSQCIVELTADAYRADLESVCSDGRCSFEIQYPPMLVSIAENSGHAVKVIASTEAMQAVFVEDVFKESTDDASARALERTREAFWLAHVLRCADSDSKQNQEKMSTSSKGSTAPGDFVGRIHAKQANALALNNRSEPVNAEVPKLSRYIRYTLERLKLDSEFKVDENPWEASEALLWYINNESVYRDEVYEWVSEISVDLNMADVLVPPEYVDSLKQLRPQWKDRRFAFNDFFEIRRHKESSWHVFSAESAIERGLMYLVAWLETAGNPSCIQFMPEKVSKEIFEITNENGLTFFEEIARCSRAL